MSTGFLILCGIISLLLVGQLKYTFMIEYGVEMLNISGSSFKYNLWGSLRKLWDEQLYFLYTFLFLFSGVWPYLKLVLLTGCVLFNREDGGTFTNNNQMKLKYVNWIACLGIWSFADIWVVVMISIVLNDNKTIHIDDNTSVTATLEVTPLDGVVVLFCGLFLSQLLNILVLYWGQSLGLASSASQGAYAQLSRGLTTNDDLDEEFENGVESDVHGVGNKVNDWHTLMNWLTKYRWCQTLIHCLYLMVLVFFIVGLFKLPLYEIKYIVMKNYISTSQFTVFGGVMHLKTIIDETNAAADDGETTNTIMGQYFLYVISMIFVIVLPLLQQVLLALLWFIPSLFTRYVADNNNNNNNLLLLAYCSSSSYQYHLHRCLHLVSHFASMEVFLISSLFVSYELGSLLNNLALGKYLSIEITLLSEFYIYFCSVLVLGGVKYVVCLAHDQRVVEVQQQQQQQQQQQLEPEECMQQGTSHSYHHATAAVSTPAPSSRAPAYDVLNSQHQTPLMEGYTHENSIVL